MDETLYLHKREKIAEVTRLSNGTKKMIAIAFFSDGLDRKKKDFELIGTKEFGGAPQPWRHAVEALRRLELLTVVGKDGNEEIFRMSTILRDYLLHDSSILLQHKEMMEKHGIAIGAGIGWKP